MFIEIKPDGSYEYPVDIFKKFPHISFPDPITPSDLPDNFYTVFSTTLPKVSPLQKLVEGMPYFKDGVFHQSWITVNLEGEELKEKLKLLEVEVRALRNRLLAETDWTQLEDVSVEVKNKYKNYRQTLRDITRQPNFPFDVNFPVKPE